MKKKLIYLLFIIIPMISFGQSNTIFETYGIRTFSAYNLYLTGQDFFGYSKSNNLDEGTNQTNIRSYFALAGNYLYQGEKAIHKITASTSFNYDYTKHKYTANDYYPETTNEKSAGSLNVTSKNSWYLMDNKGFFAFTDPSVSFSYNFSEERNSNMEIIPVGFGYGRIVNVKTVVQASIINDELETNLSEEELLQLAEIIEKNSQSYYSYKFKDNAAIEFYKDIASITKKPDQTSKIAQILGSSVYKTSVRQLGWEAKCGVTFTLFNKYRIGNYTNANDLYASFDYALPIELNKQFIASVSYSKNLKEDQLRTPKFNAGLMFSIEHTYFWTTYFTAQYASIMPKDEIPRENYSFAAKTNYTLINSLSIYLSANYDKRAFYELSSEYNSFASFAAKTEAFSTHFGFNYYIF
ncbi:MAG: hypothetical protein V1773_02960 [bacterium]